MWKLFSQDGSGTDAGSLACSDNPVSREFKRENEPKNEARGLGWLSWQLELAGASERLSLGSEVGLFAEALVAVLKIGTLSPSEFIIKIDLPYHVSIHVERRLSNFYTWLLNATLNKWP